MRLGRDNPIPLPDVAEQKAIAMGATISHGINWTWATDFPNPFVAQDFIKWLDQNGYEHRGYYHARAKTILVLPGGEEEMTPREPDGVRFR